MWQNFKIVVFHLCLQMYMALAVEIVATSFFCCQEWLCTPTILTFVSQWTPSFLSHKTTASWTTFSIFFFWGHDFRWSEKISYWTSMHQYRLQEEYIPYTRFVNIEHYITFECVAQARGFNHHFWKLLGFGLDDREDFSQSVFWKRNLI